MSKDRERNLYHMMLGLPEDIERPNHYQLLGVDPYADSRLIRNAAADQNGKLMTWQNSKYFKQAGELMRELATARGILLDSEKRKAYDKELGLASDDEEPIVLPEADPEEEPVVLAAVDETPSSPSKRRRSGGSRSSPRIAEELTPKPHWQRWVAPISAVLMIAAGTVVWAMWNRGPEKTAHKAIVAENGNADEGSNFDLSKATAWNTDEPKAESPPEPKLTPVATPINHTTDETEPAMTDSAPPLATAPFDSSEAKQHQTTWANHLNVPIEVTNSVGMKLRLIPPGEYQMGSPPEEKGRRGEKLHPVRITEAFYMGVYEVKAKGYAAMVQRHLPRDLQDRIEQSDDLPVTEITWFDALYFCNRLSENEGLPPYYELRQIGRGRDFIRHADVTVLGGEGYRLPTEAEWEFACRAGTTTKFNTDADILSDYSTRRARKPRPPLLPGGQTPANAFGLYDMHGNAGEWCFDRFDQNYYDRAPRVDPVCTEVPAGSRTGRVYRGGSHTHLIENCRSAARMWTKADERGSRRDIGLRVVRNVKHSPPQRRRRGRGSGVGGGGFY